jgi:hypothetical protein
MCYNIGLSIMKINIDEIRTFVTRTKHTISIRPELMEREISLCVQQQCSMLDTCGSCISTHIHQFMNCHNSPNNYNIWQRLSHFSKSLHVHPKSLFYPMTGDKPTALGPKSPTTPPPLFSPQFQD